jgi:hypothetical protein
MAFYQHGLLALHSAMVPNIGSFDDAPVLLIVIIEVLCTIGKQNQVAASSCDPLGGVRRAPRLCVPPRISS